jgi:hypothetical protein
MKFAEPSKLNRNPGGWGTRLFVVLPAVPNTNPGLIENLFLLSRPPALPTHRGMKRVFLIRKPQGYRCAARATPGPSLNSHSRPGNSAE